MRVVLDSNIFFSAVLYGGVPGQIVESAVAKDFTAVSSPILIDELIGSLRQKTEATPDQLRLIKQKIENMVKLVTPKETIEVVRDPDDNRVLEVAVEGKCDFVVTGDKDLLALGKYKGIKIVTAAAFASWTRPK